jgi:hypothetical protein
MQHKKLPGSHPLFQVFGQQPVSHVSRGKDNCIFLPFEFSRKPLQFQVYTGSAGGFPRCRKIHPVLLQGCCSRLCGFRMGSQARVIVTRETGIR